jgi:hypothetical protein
MICAPTARQLEIFRLCCQMPHRQVAELLGIRRNSVGLTASTAATRLIRARMTPENAADQAMAPAHYPEIARRFSESNDRDKVNEAVRNLRETGGGNSAPRRP